LASWKQRNFWAAKRAAIPAVEARELGGEGAPHALEVGVPAVEVRRQVRQVLAELRVGGDPEVLELLADQAGDIARLGALAPGADLARQVEVGLDGDRGLPGGRRWGVL
jgi:hypothetical protein